MAKLLGGHARNGASMKRLHARYPFMEGAREAVEAAEIDLADLVAEGGPSVERAIERVETCLSSGTVGDPRSDPRTELLSYPVARVLVSLLDRPALTRRYADAEARTAHERFVDELPEPGEGSRQGRGRGRPTPTGDRDRLTLRRLLAEFDLGSQIRRHEDARGQGLDDADRFRVHVGAYLSLSAQLSGEEWRLATRAMADGEVPVTREELLVLLREAVCARVAEGLPFEVPPSVAGGLEPAAGRLREELADAHPPARVRADLTPELFPPCIADLLDRAEVGESLPYHSRFTLVTFLVAAGAEPAVIESRFGEDVADTVGYQVERLGHERGTAYAPPSCSTMQAYGDCVDPDDRCETIPNPLSYYAEAVADGGTDPNVGNEAGAEAESESETQNESEAESESVAERR